MPVNRRTMLKTLALLSGSPLLSSPLIAELIATGTTPYTYLLLHGMFFMEFYDGLLYVCTPKHDCHKFFKKMHQPTPAPLQALEADIDWSQGNTVKPGKVNSFPTEILQFSINLLNAKGLPVLPGAASYACKMVLPPPKHIFGYRTDVKQNFNPLQGKIADDIRDSTGPRIATITCLQYEPGTTGPFIQSFYAEHDHHPNHAEVNDALVAAQSICGTNFDLKFDPNGSMTNPADPDLSPSLQPGVDPDYEKEVGELQTPGPRCPPPAKSGPLGTENVDVASCPQMGISHA